MSQHLVNAIVLGGIYTLFALGFSLAWGVLRILNLAYGVVATLGALMAWQLTKDRVITIVVLLPLIVVAAGLLNVVVDRLAFRRLRRESDGLELRILLASVGVVAVLITVAERMTKLDTYTIRDGVFPNRTIELFGLQSSCCSMGRTTPDTSLPAARDGHRRTFQGIRLVKGMSVRDDVMVGADAGVDLLGRLRGSVGRRTPHDVSSSTTCSASSTSTDPGPRGRHVALRRSTTR